MKGKTQEFQKYLDQYLRRRLPSHFGQLEPLLFLLSFSRGARYSPTSLAELKKADRFSREYVENAFNIAAYYHEYRHVWDVFTTLHCIQRSAKAIRLNLDYASLLRSLSLRGKHIRLPLFANSDPEIKEHAQRVERHATEEVITQGFSRFENPSLFLQLSMYHERFFPKASPPPIRGDCVLGSRPILETLGLLWGTSALTFDPEFVNSFMERIWWRGRTIPESWPYVLILSQFKSVFKKISECVEYGGTIAALDLALQTENDHPGIRLTKILDAIDKEHRRWSSSPSQFQEDLCDCLGFDPPTQLLSRYRESLRRLIGAKDEGSFGNVFFNDVVEFLNARLARPESVLKPVEWETTMVSSPILQILVDMPSFYSRGKARVLYAKDSPRTRAYLAYALLNAMRQQSYSQPRVRCPWASSIWQVEVQHYDCAAKSARRCVFPTNLKPNQRQCLFFQVCDALKLSEVLGRTS